LTVGADLFERQLDYLRRHRFRSGDLRALDEVAAGRVGAPTAFLTFDDGFRDNYETAMPLLREYGFGAFVFVLPPLVDTGASFEWPEVLADRRRCPSTMRSVTWEMLGEMKEHDFEVGSHTLTHAHLPELDEVALRDELSESRARIKRQLGACDTLAYPFGEWSEKVAAAAADCGYRYAFTLPSKTGQRTAGLHSIPRINIDYRDRERRLAAKLSGIGKRTILSPAVVAARRRMP
jgi:peptidoglycan/xylan/chitin deacetylase (PgdA/CDA1 family)